MVVNPFALFLLTIVLSVLRFTDSGYPIGVFRLFCDMEQYDFKIFEF